MAAATPTPTSGLFRQFASPEGASLCRKVASEKLGFDPHDYVVEGVCKALDGLDLLAVTPTGSGKTSFLIIYLLVISEILQHPELCPSAKFPLNPVMLVVCPTKSLEYDMEPKFAKATLSPLVINSDTVDNGRRATPPLNLWDKAATTDVNVILLAPEQLRKKGYAGLMANDAFQTRIVAMAVDEVHLMDAWGESFRPAFKQIGHARARVTGKAILIALTATLRAGAPMRSVCTFLGLLNGGYHFIRRSNMRHDITIQFRTVQSGARSMTFPELNWVLDSKRRVIVFCRTIALGFRVAVYLWHRAAALPDRPQRIRFHNALNAPSYNTSTLGFLHDDNRSRVTIATDTLAVGIDVANTDDVVLYEHELPSNTDMILQKIGRIRDGSGGRNARGIVYLPKNAEQQARKIVDQLGAPSAPKRAKTGRSGTAPGRHLQLLE
ncbi:uncharacterized protein TRAVEDRAFT_22912 [Trametes versicolor FP-101664 SS1]|uniref:uncharacterized protein n=1 Tax=Trametes versicolor (strain FP-101664) TaxID=717944 RepID=UPI0004623B7F|nr:uncharacterized protein TRAVEDRAFT_22912 [Trametes versicolor FP-101664 SS1]EIW55146.1 hypothetical protein TRAVEDRAFT_22912 [Trametes versicolor FP-101664 SS1]